MKKFALILSSIAVAVCNTHGQLLVEPFTYSDGPLIDRPGSPWTSFSGTTPGQQNVVSNELFLDDGETEDTIASFGAFGGPGQVLTMMLDLRNGADISSSAAGDYITSFVVTGGTLQIGRLFTSSSPGGAADDFRLGVATTSGTPVFFVATFTALTTYSIALTYDFDSNLASLTVAGFGTVTATDAVDTPSIDRIQLRQGGGSQGDQFLDNLTVIPEPGTYMLLGIGALLCAQQFRRRKSKG